MIKKKFITSISFILTLSWVKMVQAQVLGGNDSIISPPVGSDILPGGGAVGETIQESILFARILPFAINYLIGLVAALSVVALIYAGYQYFFSMGGTDQEVKARKTALYAVIGLILAITSFGIVRIVTAVQFN